MRGTQLARQWRIVRLLETRRRGLTAREIADELDDDIRTVYRDLDALQEAGFPLYTDKVGKNSFWKFLDLYRSEHPIPFSATELMSLHMSGELFKVFEGTIFHQSIEMVLSKVRAALAPEMVRYLEQASNHLTIGFSPRRNYDAFKDVIKVVSEATANRRRLEIRYKAASTGRTTVRKVDPYQVWALNGTFYLIGFCHVRNSIRTFVLDRIKSFTVLEESFDYPQEFSLEDYLQSAFRVMRGDPQTVKVRFARNAAHVVKERIWHPSQEIREQRNGDLVATMDVPINYEIVSWILGFGSAAEVLEPQELRKRVREEHLAAAKAYDMRVPSLGNTFFEEEILPRVS